MSAARKTSSETPRYVVGKIAERKWGIYFRLDERTSFFQRVSYPTKREAESIVRLLNRAEGYS